LNRFPYFVQQGNAELKRGMTDPQGLVLKKLVFSDMSEVPAPTLNPFDLIEPGWLDEDGDLRLEPDLGGEVIDDLQREKREQAEFEERERRRKKKLEELIEKDKHEKAEKARLMEETKAEWTEFYPEYKQTRHNRHKMREKRRAKQEKNISETSDEEVEEKWIKKK
jgi:hypothetical protein